MTFRARLTAFFLLLVVVPIAVLGGLVTQLSSDSATGKADARLGTALEPAIGLVEVSLRGGGNRLGVLRASTVTARAVAERAAELTNTDAVVLIGAEPVAGTIELDRGEEFPRDEAADTIEVDGEELRVASAGLGGAEPGARSAVFSSLETASFFTQRPFMAASLLALLAVALVFIVLLVRALQGQIGAMLAAAKRIGRGDFSRKVPAEGDDEMAGLAREFNRMSDKLSEQMAELRRQRAELEQSIRRIGEAFARGFDREALLEIAAETALAACEAESSRIVLTGRAKGETEAGVPVQGAAAEAARTAESAAIKERGEAEVRRDDVHALAGALTGVHEGNRVLGVMSIARQGSPFESGQRELFRYLIGQASISVENIDLHEMVSEQAITDELTGLSNQRRFRELVGKEAARAQRFGHELALMILDIDDFKPVNDIHGHLQGDEVLKEIGRILLDESRGVDEPARYGGEEFVLALPETDADGALEVAERIRRRIEAARIPHLDGSGTIAVTASIGVAAMPEAAGEMRELIAATDRALYEAKRNGKNRCEQAPPRERSAWSIAAQGQPAERRT